MEIHQFAEQLKQKANPSPLMKALEALRTCNLDQLRDHMKGEMFGAWWQGDDLAQTPQTSVLRP